MTGLGFECEAISVVARSIAGDKHPSRRRLFSSLQAEHPNVALFSHKARGAQLLWQRACILARVVAAAL